MEFYVSAFIQMMLSRWGGDVLVWFLRDYQGRRVLIRLGEDPLGDSLPGRIDDSQFVLDDGRHLLYKQICRVKIGIPKSNHVPPRVFKHYSELLKVVREGGSQSTDLALDDLRNIAVGNFLVHDGSHQLVENIVRLGDDHQCAGLYHGLEGSPNGFGIVLTTTIYPVPLGTLSPIFFAPSHQEEVIRSEFAVLGL